MILHDDVIEKLKEIEIKKKTQAYLTKRILNDWLKSNGRTAKQYKKKQLKKKGE